MIFINGKRCRLGLTFVNGVKDYFNLYLNQTEGGTINGSPSSGHRGDEITLYNIPSAHYSFNGYSVTGGTLNDNKITLTNSDVTAQAEFIEDPIYNLYLIPGAYGSIEADKLTGYEGDEVNLSNTPVEGAVFNGYSLTGATLDGSKFDFENSNVSAEGNFSYNPLNLNPYTVRMEIQGSVPVFRNGTVKQVSYGVYDLTNENTNWYNLFRVNGSISSVKKILGINSIGVTNMTDMFRAFGNYLSSVPSFDTTTVTCMSGMFYGCGKLKDAPNLNTQNVVNTENMFMNCSSLSSVPLYNTSNVSSMKSMFYFCGKLSSVPLYNTSNVKTMETMFMNCSSLSEVPQFDTHNVSSMNGTFLNCSSLKDVPMLDTTNVKKINEYVENCVNISGGISAFYNQLTAQDVPPTSYYLTFSNCGINTTQGQAELDQIPSDWK